MEEIFRYKKDILPALDKCLSTDSQNIWQKDLFGRLREYTKGGKLIRGCLALYTFDIFNTGKADVEGTPLAVALELTQAAFLIHDDIIDRDNLRRGKPSIHTQYQNLLKEHNATDWEHGGKSLAVCAGDAAIFLAYEQISRLSCGDNIKNRILNFVSTEWQRVCYGQMQDIWYGVGGEAAGVQNIFEMYRDKTARYTFSVPLVTGGILGNQPDQVLQTLDKLGENIGLLFQLRDDELNLSGDIKRTGKPVESDLRENKQTYWRALDFDKSKIYDLMESLEEKAQKLIEELPIGRNNKMTLRELTDFVRNREK